MKDIPIALAAISCNVAAQVLMKFASRGGFNLRDITYLFSLPVLASIVLYGLSFLLTLQVFSSNALSIASPLMAGISFIGIGIASWYFFSEDMTMTKVAGMLVIALGIYLLTRTPS